MKYSIPQLGFNSTFQEKGITITELQNLKNITTNWMQELRRPFEQAKIYDDLFKPKNFNTEQIIKGFVPDLTTIDSSVSQEGRINAFNNFATKVMEAHQAIKSSIANVSWNQLVDTAELEKLQAELNDLTKQRPTAPEHKVNKTEMFDYFTVNEIAEYLLAEQTASALGNLILATPENSNHPRNFLYQISNQTYGSSVSKDEQHLYTPVLNGGDLQKYRNKFYDIQRQHRDWEKKKNFLKAKYQNWLDAENQKLAEENTVVANQYQADLNAWNTAVTSLRTQITALEHKLKTEAEAVRKDLQVQFFAKRINLPEMFRQIMVELKAKQNTDIV